MGETLTRNQAAQLAGMTVQAIDLHIKKKSFKTTRYGNRDRWVAIDKKSFQDWLKGRQEVAA